MRVVAVMSFNSLYVPLPLIFAWSTFVRYFTVPFDRGWTALVDGEEAAVLDSGSMIAIPVASGDHTLELRYRTPGLYAGAALSLVSLALCAGLYGFLRRKKR